MKNKELIEKHNLLLELLRAFRDVCEKGNIWYSLAFGSVLGAIRHNGFIPWDRDADVYIFLKDEIKFHDAFFKYKPNGIMLTDRSKDKRILSSHNRLFFEGGKADRIHLDIYPIVGAPTNKKEQIRFANRNYYTEKIIKSKYVDIRECLPKNKIFVLGAKIIDYMIPDSILKKILKRQEMKYDYDSSEYWSSLICYGGDKSCFPKRILEGRILHKFENEMFYIPSGWEEYLKLIYGDYMKPKKY